MKRIPGFIMATALVVLGGVDAHSFGADALFETEIRSILADNCFDCHGPDAEARKADLRLDTFEGATAVRDGAAAIVPGNRSKSLLLERVATEDADDRMPPESTGKQLTQAEIESLRRWIESGADYVEHWAFSPPESVSPPPTAFEWGQNPIDAFIMARLKEMGGEPSPEADPETLLRRVSLDLVGLPPSIELQQAFPENRSYEWVVDRLLESSAYGEKWARSWLDMARYADTNGYEKDRNRSIWPYRDWVIDALNADMPYDQFSIEQLAGDMLPNATLNQRIATGFHRNTMLNEEGGIDPLEYRYYAMVDRVGVTGTVWMGLTLACAQCHDHKYDPISQKDFYAIMAAMDDAEEIEIPTPDSEGERRRREIDEEIQRLKADRWARYAELMGSEAKAVARFVKWSRDLEERASDWETLIPESMSSNGPRLVLEEDGVVFTIGDATKRDLFEFSYALRASESAPVSAIMLEALPDPRLPANGPGRAYYEGRKGDFFLSEVSGSMDGRVLEFGGASVNFGKISIGSGSAEASNVIDGKGSTGWSTATREGEPHRLVLNLKRPITKNGSLKLALLFERHFVASLGKLRVSITRGPPQAAAFPYPRNIERLFADGMDNLDPALREAARVRFLDQVDLLEEVNAEIDTLSRSKPEPPTTLVFDEFPNGFGRTTYRRHRGEYLEPREPVEPAGLSLFSPINDPDEAVDRLALARWLVSAENPMGDRVVVNRAWQRIFGTGIVETVEDFGTRGAYPTHPELLDWLARWFAENGRSLKALHRLIVTSATYRQSSVVTERSSDFDPEGRWLSRFPRQRLPGETLRDAALAASGALTRRIGGPSVFPPQPKSVSGLAYGGFKWTPDSDEDRYRRSLYTFAKRTAPFAAYMVYDGVSGEQCVARRRRSVSPLQALTSLNDTMYVELAQRLAERVLATDDTAFEARLDWVYRWALARAPESEEVAAIRAYYQEQRARLESGALDARKIIGDSETAIELAAWTLVSRAVLNLDEWLTKE